MFPRSEVRIECSRMLGVCVLEISNKVQGSNFTGWSCGTYRHSIVLAPLGRSDHAILICNFQAVSARRDPTTSRNVWKYDSADWNRLRALYLGHGWQSIMSDDPTLYCERLTSAILQGMDQYIPTKVFTTRSSDPHWWTPECTIAEEAKEKQWKKWRQNPHRDDLKTSFIASVNRAVRTQQSAHMSSVNRLRHTLSCQSLSDKQWWTNMKKATGATRNSADVPLLVDSHGKEFHTSAEKAECLAKHFSSKCS